MQMKGLLGLKKVQKIKIKKLNGHKMLGSTQFEPKVGIGHLLVPNLLTALSIVFQMSHVGCPNAAQ